MADEMNSANGAQEVNLSGQKVDKMLKDHHNFRKIIALIIAIIILALIATFFYNMADENSYDITITGNIGSLQLSFDPEFENGYETIKAVGRDKMYDDDGGTLSQIQKDIDGVITGEKEVEILSDGRKGNVPGNSDEFSIAKCYLKNKSSGVGSETVNYKIKINTYDISRNAFSAARIMICKVDKDGNVESKEVYAQPNADGESEVVATAFKGADYNMKDEDGNDWMCKNFKQDEHGEWYYDSLEFDDMQLSIKPDEVHCYVIAVWYEGSDPDHSNAINGGSYSLGVSFETI